MSTINLDDYNVYKPILIGITKIIDECINNHQPLENAIHSNNPEISRFINDCITALN